MKTYTATPEQKDLIRNRIDNYGRVHFTIGVKGDPQIRYSSYTDFDHALTILESWWDICEIFDID